MQSQPSPAPLVEVEGVWKKFLHEEREVVILKDIDLRIEQGEMLAVVGPSGAGKSTLLHILGTLDLPTAGSIRYQGRDVTRYSAAQLAAFRNDSLGFVFQFHHLLPEFTALENVMMPGLIQGKKRRAVEYRAKELLDEVGLSHRLSHRPGELSGGEQQRVAIARAVAKQPDVLLCDEPTGALDFRTGKLVLEVLERINRELGTTTAVITHNAPIAKLADRVITLADGRIATVDHNETKLHPNEIEW